jgi:hypothetical protein
MRWHDSVFGHAAVGHQPVKADRRADVVVAGAARGAATTLVDRLDRDAVTDFPIRDACPDIGDDAREFVPKRQRQLTSGERMRLGGNEDRARVVLVQIGTADAVEADLQLHGAWARIRLGHVGDLDLVRSVIDGCFHAPVVCDRGHTAKELHRVAMRGELQRPATLVRCKAQGVSWVT